MHAHCHRIAATVLAVAGIALAGCASRAARTPADTELCVEWDRSTLRRVSSAAVREGYNGYGRMVQLQDGSLRCVYEANARIVVVASHDLGDTWSEPVVVAHPRPNLCLAVPEILELADGALLASFNPRPCPPGPDRRFAIWTARSTDGGATWSEPAVAHEAGTDFHDGCWEPAAIQLPDGDICLFFADEGPYTQSAEQNISMVRSTDGGATWSSPPQIVSFRAGKRDGMPSPLLLEDQGRIVVAIEDNGHGAFKPFIVEGPIEGAWRRTVDGDSSHRRPALAVPLPPEVYAGAPSLRRLSTGETILSYQGTEGRRNEEHRYAAMRLAVGDSRARNFGGTTVPFDIPRGYAGLWNGLAVLDDDTIVAITSTSAYTPGQVEVWMVKGRLASRATVAPSGH